MTDLYSREKMEQTIAHNLRTGRKNLHMTQAELSELCGVSKVHISKYERGYRTPSLLTSIRICDALEIDLNLFVRQKLAIPGNTEVEFDATQRRP